MNEEYLWDRTGGDPEIERLEKILRPLAYRRPSPRLAPLSMAAAVALFAAFLWIAPADHGWIHVTREARTFEFANVGSVVAEPDSKLKIVAAHKELHKLRLEHGTIHARIGADVRPRLFQVETPATTCVDLGCVYTLTVDRNGRSSVRVLTGRVAFVDGDREVYIPAGASCYAAPRRGSATPRFEDTPQELASLLAAIDAGQDRLGSARRLRVERLKDTLPLWHLLRDRDTRVVEIVLDLLVGIAELPEGVTREETLRRDPAALEAWKEHLRPYWW